MNLNINIIDGADASKNLACNYARSLKKDGIYSYQLVFSNIIPDGLTQSRVELFATVMYANTGELVRRVFQSNHKDTVKLCDSQVTLFWINNQGNQVKQ